MVASLPCGFELGVLGPFNRLFGLAMQDERRSGSATTSTRASGRRRSAVRRRFAGRGFGRGFAPSFAPAREATCSIEPLLGMFGNIQGARRYAEGSSLLTARLRPSSR